jgi:hypothetical protein
VYLFLALIVVLIGLWISPEYNISDVPFSQLTLRMVFGSLLGTGAYIGAFFLFVKSLTEDRIWPWRWTWPYFGNLVIRSVLVVFITWGGFWLIDKKHLDGVWLVVAAIFIFIGILYAMFSSEIEHFSEPEIDEKESKSKSGSNVSRPPNLSDHAPWTEENDKLIEAIIKSNTHPQIGIDQINEILTAGININAKNKSGRTALSIAKYYEVPSAARVLLIRAGAKD